MNEYSEHITVSLADLSSFYGLHEVVNTTNRCIVIQMADDRVNKFIDSWYVTDNTAIRCLKSVTGNKLEYLERVGCIIHTVIAPRNERELILRFFLKCGLLTGFKEVHQYFVPLLFTAGIPLQDSNLPFVSCDYTVSQPLCELRA